MIPILKLLQVLTVQKPVAVMSTVTGNVVNEAAKTIPDVPPHVVASALAIVAGGIICSDPALLLRGILCMSMLAHAHKFNIKSMP